MPDPNDLDAWITNELIYARGHEYAYVLTLLQEHRAALRRYGQHEAACRGRYVLGDYEQEKCNCGLDAVLAGKP